MERRKGGIVERNKQSKNAYSVLMVTTDKQRDVSAITKTLLSQKLAACVNVIDGMSSNYRWKGKIEKTKEKLLIIKTKKTLVKKVIKKVKEMHSYEVPEIIVLVITDGSKDYLDWIGRETV